MDEGVVEKLIEFVENASPVVWNAALKQVQIDAIRYTILAALVLAISIAIFIFAAITYKWYKEGDKEFEHACISFSSIAFVFVLIASGIAWGAISRFINPTWYAIQNILSLIP